MEQRPKGKTQNPKTPGRYNIGENLHDLGYGNDFSAITPKTVSVKELIDKLGSKIKYFRERQCQEKQAGRRLGVTSAKNTANKRPLSKIYKEILKVNKKTKNPI